MTATILGTVPSGSRLIRQATIDDILEDSRRLLLWELPDGSQQWVGSPPDGQAIQQPLAPSSQQMQG